MSNFDLSALALGALAPGNEILVDDLGYPSVMVYVPKMTYAQLGLGTSTATFPAFIVNGTEVDGIWISKYQNIVICVFSARPGSENKHQLRSGHCRLFCERCRLAPDDRF